MRDGGLSFSESMDLPGDEQSRGAVRGFTVTLFPADNRFTIVRHGAVSEADLLVHAPTVFQRLADSSRLPVRAYGRVFMPCRRGRAFPMPADQTTMQVRGAA